MVMKGLLATAAVVGTMVVTTAPADARQGCGGGLHRGYRGYCVPNRGPRYGPVVGGFYPGRGYWYGGRYWGHRYRWHGGWRYR